MCLVAEDFIQTTKEACTENTHIATIIRLLVNHAGIDLLAETVGDTRRGKH